MFTLKLVRLPLATLGLAVLAACGGGGDESTPPPPAATYTIGGSVAGLQGTGLVLQLNGANNLTVSANGAFTFPGTLTAGTAYAVTVSAQPSTPTQTCTVTSGTGTASSNVTGVLVNCSTTTFRVRGNVTGLVGSGLTLRNNGGDNLSIAASGPFTFTTPVPSGGAYEVSVFAQPSNPTQTCTVASGSGTITNADATGVAVTCTTNNYTVGGTVSGLSGTIVLRNTSGTTTNQVTVTSDGAFSFPAQASGTTYSVTIFSHSNPAQVCTVANSSGTVATSNVSNIGISCSTTTFTIGGAVSGLNGTGLVLRNNGGDSKPITANGAFTFATAVASGSGYNVTVQTQPSSPAQTCSVGNATGTAAANVTNVTVTCVNNNFTVGGTVTGLSGSGLVLRKTTGGVTSDLPVSASGSFSFPSQADGTAYVITVHAQPSSPTQSCGVTSGSGTVAGANITNVAVTCTTTTFAVGGTVSGLAGTGLVLQNNGADNKTISADGAFSFATAIDSGAAYAVTVSTQPSSPSQNCIVTNGSGTVGAAAITDVAVNCTTNQYIVSGSINGYTGTGLVLRETIGATTIDHPVSNGGTSFAFAAQDDGTSYAVTVLTQPNTPTQTCLVTGGSGSVSGANVSNVDVTCTTNQYTVGGTVSGLIGTVVLQNNGGDDKSISANGAFTFTTSVASGAAYNVTVLTQPSSPAQTCTPTGNTGTVTSANVANVTITCVSADLTAPTVTTSSRLPQDTTVGTALQTDIVVDVSEALMPSTVTASSVTVTSPSGPVAGTVTLSNGGTRITFDPTALLSFDTTYTVTLAGTILDVSGNALTQHVWSFNTGHRVAVGGYHTCARLDGANNGVVKCWGSNAFGQLGLGDTASRGDGVGDAVNAALPPVDLGTNRTVVDIVAGENHTCARLDNGDVKCWGFNAYGQLGVGSTTYLGDDPGEMGDNLPTVFSAADNIVQIVAGIYYNCARSASGVVKCWGSNEYAQPGQNTDYVDVQYYDTPQTVNMGGGLPALKGLVSGGRFTCAHFVTDQIKCWGHNDWGQLGLGDAFFRGDGTRHVDSYGFVDFGTNTVKQIIATSGHACAILDDNSTKCWGNNWFGQTGRGSYNAVSGAHDCVAAEACIGDDPSETPNLLLAVDFGVVGATPVELGGGDRQTCVRFSNNKVKCWGDNEYGQLGLGNTDTQGDDPNEVSSLPFVDLGTGYVAVELPAGGSNYHNCAVLNSGAVKCWGRNNKQSDLVLGAPVPSGGGQLGLGSVLAQGDGAGEMGDDLDAVDLTP